MWQNSKCDNSKTQNVTKIRMWQLKNSKCDKTIKLKMWQTSRTQKETKLKNSKCDKTQEWKKKSTQNVTTQKLKMWQSLPTQNNFSHSTTFSVTIKKIVINQKLKLGQNSKNQIDKKKIFTRFPKKKLLKKSL